MATWQRPRPQPLRAGALHRCAHTRQHQALSARACLYTCLYTCLHTCLYTRLYIHMYIYTDAYTDVYKQCLYIYMHIHMPIQMLLAPSQKSRIWGSKIEFCVVCRDSFGRSVFFEVRAFQRYVICLVWTMSY